MNIPGTSHQVRFTRSGGPTEQAQAMSREIRKILIIRLSSLGDVILTTPVITALKAKFLDSELFFLTKARYADLLRNDPRISSLVEFDTVKRHHGVSGFMRLISELRSHDFDLLIARGDREGSAFVVGNLSDIRQGGDLEVVNEVSVISRFPYE